MFRSCFFLNAVDPVREDLLSARRLTLAHDDVRRVLDERCYHRAEIWRGDRIVAQLASMAMLLETL